MTSSFLNDYVLKTVIDLLTETMNYAIAMER